MNACISAPNGGADPACTSTADCGGRGAVCDEGVCWGNPPDGDFAAVLSPAAGSDGARTEIAPLWFTANGWISGASEGAPRLVLASTVRVRGQITAPCPPELADCDGTFPVPATVRFTYPSAIDDRRVVLEASMAGADYQVVLPRTTVLMSYQVTITPSDTPLGNGLPSPAELLAPRRLDLAVDPAAGDDVRLNLVLTDTGSLRLLAGTLTRPPPASPAGWRVHAEAPGLDDVAGLERVSNIARVDASGGYKLWVPIDRGPVDLVVSPPGSGGDVPAPGLRRRGLPVAQAVGLPPLSLPPPGEVTTVNVSVTGTTGGGDSELVDGARVIARMDQLLSPDLYLVHRVLASTSERGAVDLALWSPAPGTVHAYEYALDVLPASGVEQAARFGWPLPLEPGAAPSVSIPLDRRDSIRGQIVDQDGVGVGGATVSATLSAGIRCELAGLERVLSRALPPLTATTAPDGTFVLWVDQKLFERDLRYDVHVEPAPDSAPSWTYEDVAPGGDVHPWRLPEAAHVRGPVQLADGRPAADTLVQVYAHVDAQPCANQPGLTPPGAVQLRAVGRVDADGVVRLVLPRPSMPTVR